MATDVVRFFDRPNAAYLDARHTPARIIGPDGVFVGETWDAHIPFTMPGEPIYLLATLVGWPLCPVHFVFLGIFPDHFPVPKDGA